MMIKALSPNPSDYCADDYKGTVCYLLSRIIACHSLGTCMCAGGRGSSQMLLQPATHGKMFGTLRMLRLSEHHRLTQILPKRS